MALNFGWYTIQPEMSVKKRGRGGGEFFLFNSDLSMIP